ncbi:PREDICTED: PDF receptor-like, partial [Priapulus caudatus]|uniref:PDF receptor-like n=1 Tax=Priapulus caudatus TaxID=37621 RepID=A0ABM1EYX8_PRICU
MIGSGLDWNNGWNNIPIQSLENCRARMEAKDNLPFQQGLSCDATWDSLLCWPATAAGTTAALPCPAVRGSDTTKQAYRRCLEDGEWAERTPGTNSRTGGWTNYTECYAQEVAEPINLMQTTLSNQVSQDLAK